jgi:hypothetical protein
MCPDMAKVIPPQMLQHLPHLRLSIALEISLPCPGIQNAATLLAPYRSVRRQETLKAGFRFSAGSFFPFPDAVCSDIYSRRIKSCWHPREELIR